MRVTVLGAAGGIGRSLTAELVARGHDVTAVTRSGRAGEVVGARPVAADLYDPSSTRAACADAEVVVLAAMPPYHAWAGNFERMLEVTGAAVVAAGARLIFVDNLYMYGPADGPISEQSPEHATGKGALRRVLARRLLEEDRFTATVGRASDYYGPGGTNSFLHRMVLEPALAGRPARVMLAGDQPHTWHYLPDLARTFSTLVEHPEADGRAWVLPAAPPLTQHEVIGLVRETLDAPVRATTITPGLLALASLVSRQAREGRKVAHQFDRPWVADASAFEATFGPFVATSHRTAIRATLSWLRDPDAAGGLHREPSG